MNITADIVDLYVGQRLKTRRDALGVSQGRLARHLGLTFSQVQKYEKGANRISAGRLFLIASFLGVPVKHFLEGLEESSRGGGAEPVDKAATELAVLDNAYMSIADSDKRKSVLALVCALAGRGQSRAAAPRASRLGCSSPSRCPASTVRWC